MYIRPTYFCLNTIVNFRTRNKQVHIYLHFSVIMMQQFVMFPQIQIRLCSMLRPLENENTDPSANCKTQYKHKTLKRCSVIYKSFPDWFIKSSSRMVSTSTSYSSGSEFKCSPGDRQSGPRFFVVFVSPRRKIITTYFTNLLNSLIIRFNDSDS